MSLLSFFESIFGGKYKAEITELEEDKRILTRNYQNLMMEKLEIVINCGKDKLELHETIRNLENVIEQLEQENLESFNWPIIDTYPTFPYDVSGIHDFYDVEFVRADAQYNLFEKEDWVSLLDMVHPLVEEALEQHPFLTVSEQPGFLELRSGIWEVEGDLVLPDGFGLWATRPVTLTFDRQALLFSNGPLLLQGPDDGGIHLGPKDDHWAGLIVLQAGTDQASILHNVEIRATAGISRDGWVTTGGVTFYESPVVLSDCRLLDSIAEDTINVLRSKFEFVRSEFGHAASDAFDADFAQGRVEQCAFHDVRGDGIDVSGSVIAVEDVTLLRIYDKGISAGEGSVVDVKNVHAADVGMAIASKDMSHVAAREVSVARAWIAGLAAYLKKMEYGPASIEASRVVFEDDSRKALVQTGSRVTIDGEDATTAELDVDELYRRLEALAAIRPLNYQFGPAMRLLDYELVTPQVGPGDELRLMLYWQADARPEEDYTVFVHVLDAVGGLVAQRDNMPRDNDFPTTRWPVGPLIDDVHVVPLPSDVPAGEYRVVIGMYVWQTGERLPVHRPGGEGIPDGAVVLDQTLEVGN